MLIYNSYKVFSLDDWKWKHFTPKELACKCNKHCAGQYNHDPIFLDKLEQLREYVGRPLKINSATRCSLHNAAVGGAPLSQHKRGAAVDISVAGWDKMQRAILLKGVMLYKFKGIGYANTFLHLDNRAGRVVEWDYAKGGMAKWKSLLY